MPHLTKNAKILILSNSEEEWSIRKEAQYYNTAKSTVQRIKQIIHCPKKVKDILDM
jgi:IS30 family transposase